MDDYSWIEGWTVDELLRAIETQTGKKPTTGRELRVAVENYWNNVQSGD